MERELIVVKYGSSAVVAGTDSADNNAQNNINWFTDQLAELHAQHDLIVVSSGAVALGKAMSPEIPTGVVTEENQFFAMRGNPFLMTLWIRAFQNRHIAAGELLLTHREIEDDKTPDSPGSELRSALSRCRALHAVAVVNENDAISRLELAKLEYGGDNDGLSAHIAINVGAKALFLMTNSNGVIDRRSQRKKTVAPQVSSWESVRNMSQGIGPNGRGGMKTKTSAAIEVSREGIPAYIAPANKSFASIRDGRFGTYFEPAMPTGTLEQVTS